MISVCKRYAVWHFCLILALSGCGSFYSRPTPSRETYLTEYFAYFDATQIEKLDYVYEGAIGGIATVGRAKFRDSIRLNESLVEGRIKSGVLEVGTYDPAAMAKGTTVADLKFQWKSDAGGTIPSWFDFPYQRKMRILREASEESEATPRHETVWYIDDERNVVYVRGRWG